MWTTHVHDDKFFFFPFFYFKLSHSNFVMLSSVNIRATVFWGWLKKSLKLITRTGCRFNFVYQRVCKQRMCVCVRSKITRKHNQIRKLGTVCGEQASSLLHDLFNFQAATTMFLEMKCLPKDIDWRGVLN